MINVIVTIQNCIIIVFIVLEFFVLNKFDVFILTGILQIIEEALFSDNYENSIATVKCSTLSTILISS